MNTTMMRASLISAGFCAAMAWRAAGAAPAPADSTQISFHIEQQPLQEALTTFANQAGVQLLLDVKEVGAPTAAAPQLVGAYTREAALEKLLSSSGLVFKFVDSQTVIIRPAGNSGAAVSGAAHADTMIWRLAQAGGEAGAIGLGTAGENAAGAQGGDGGRIETQLEEVIVTAQKTPQRLQDVPVPVAVINAQALADRNQVLMRDYLQTIPSVVLAPGVQGVQTVAIRGITTGTGNPTVAVMLDGVPFNAGTNTGGGRILPDIDPGDLASIEVLRGPQGTLYGATSLGGLLNFVTRDPSMDGVSGQVQVGTTVVESGNEAGYNVRGAINVPVSETVAVRASAFSRNDPGYIDDPAQAERDVNQGDAHGYRTAALWKPSDIFSLKLTALGQKASQRATQSVDLPAGTLHHSRFKGTGPISRQIGAYSATAKLNFGSAELTSLTGFSNTKLFENEAGDARTAAPTGTTQITHLDADKFVQELRFTTPLGGKLDLLVGAFYTDEDATLLLDYFPVDRSTGAFGARLTGLDIFTKLEEYAGFADLTLHVTDRFDVQFGSRISDVKQKFAQNDLNHLPIPAQNLRADSSPKTYLMTPSFKISDDLMVYLRYSTGYRVGGGNVNGGRVSSVVGLIPVAYEPDETVNYDAGLKGSFFDRRLVLDASVYRIDWKEIQYNQLAADFLTTFTANGARAKSQGVELSATSRPLPGLTVEGWIAVGEAELTETFSVGSTVQGLPGFSLPYNAEKSGHLSLRQDFRLTDRLDAFASVGVNYVGERLGPFRAAATPQRQVYPSYTQADVSFGISQGAWTGSLFANNVTDERGVINGGLGVSPSTALVYTTPRVIGASLSKSF